MNGMSGMGMGGMGTAPLTTHGVDFSNMTQASDFLSELLDDTKLQVVGNMYARFFWYGVVVFIGRTSAINLGRRYLLQTRMLAALEGNDTPASPTSWGARAVATVTAMGRELSYLQVTPVKHQRYFDVPPLGNVLVILGYFGFVMALEFINNDVPGDQYYEGLGLRAAWLAIAQVPLLILLVGKYNWIGLITGIGYERLNIYHRWVARMLLLLATFHFAFQAGGWTHFPGMFHLEWTTDICIPTGLSTYIILVWINLSTLAPLRNLGYEIFVAQHIISFFGFIIALMIHLPTTALYSRVYIYIPIGLYLFDRLVRFLRFAFVNVKSSNAHIEALDGGATKLRFHNSRLSKWHPGSHVLVSFPTVAFAQNHPATILSRPETHGGDIVLLLKAQTGFTKRLHSHAARMSSAVASEDAPTPAKVESQSLALPVLVDGPFVGRGPDFMAFDSVCFIAGSTGITFVLSHLLDLASRAQRARCRFPLRRVCVTWCVKEAKCVDWVSSELSSAFAKLGQAGVDVHVAIYLTCQYDYDDSGAEKVRGRLCGCDKMVPPAACCCVSSEDAGLQSQIIKRLVKREEASDSSSDSQGKRQMSPSPANKEAHTESQLHVSVSIGRPVCRDVIERCVEASNGESGVTVCGPLSMAVDVRKAVVSLSDERAVHKGTGAQGIYLHVEGFSQ